jgi:hypothetical protein
LGIILSKNTFVAQIFVPLFAEKIPAYKHVFYFTKYGLGFILGDLKHLVTLSWLSPSICLRIADVVKQCTLKCPFLAQLFFSAAVEIAKKCCHL